MWRRLSSPGERLLCADCVLHRAIKRRGTPESSQPPYYGRGHGREAPVPNINPMEESVVEIGDENSFRRPFIIHQNAFPPPILPKVLWRYDSRYLPNDI